MPGGGVALLRSQAAVLEGRRQARGRRGHRRPHRRQVARGPAQADRRERRPRGRRRRRAGPRPDAAPRASTPPPATTRTSSSSASSTPPRSPARRCRTRRRSRRCSSPPRPSSPTSPRRTPPPCPAAAMDGLLTEVGRPLSDGGLPGSPEATGPRGRSPRVRAAVLELGIVVRRVVELLTSSTTSSSPRSKTSRAWAQACRCRASSLQSRLVDRAARRTRRGPRRAAGRR